MGLLLIHSFQGIKGANIHPGYFKLDNGLNKLSLVNDHLEIPSVITSSLGNEL